MASIFTYQEEPPRVHSPWSTPGSSTPQRGGITLQNGGSIEVAQPTSITKLEPEKHDGPTEYKLHLLLRSRRGPPTIAPSIPRPTVSVSDSHAERPVPSAQTQQRILSRQARLQQLTTQLLWRLQQSSPFHSSSNADLVLPMLPEATPRLGVPDRPAKLLSGLEESQGALYEIGVADDGTLVGLTEDELEESLNNLRAMASSLGCVVDILRRVLVAEYEAKARQNIDQSDSKLVRIWVAEVLVRPDAMSPKILPLEEADTAKALSQSKSDEEESGRISMPRAEQLRIAITGATTAGKSSLVGTLTTSKLDNGRGKSRLSLLKHRHEITSGVTSSVAQELLGYRDGIENASVVVNYASGNVSSWPDIHNLANRLVFISDSPGLPRYAKSTFRTLVSWVPNWTLMCIAADENDNANGSVDPLGRTAQSDAPQASIPVSDSADLSLTHLDLCVKLDLPLMVVVTKMDVATKTGLKTVLSKVLSALKAVGRTPVLLSSPSTPITNQDENTDVASELVRLNDRERIEVSALLEKIRLDEFKSIVPIVLTSAVTGVGIAKLHALLNGVDIYERVTLHNDNEGRANAALFHVDEIFAIPPSRVYLENREEHSADHGIVLCGHVATGRLAIGDRLRLGPFISEAEHNTTESSHIPRSASYSLDNGRRPMPRALSDILSKSLQIDQSKATSQSMDVSGVYLDVNVVSLRSLRLPMRSMDAGETGTVGVQPVTYPSPVPLGRSRKGMILTSVSSDDLFGYRSFSAVFSAANFAHTDSPPLLLGGLAIVYVNSVRAAVKVTALTMDDGQVDTEPPSPTEMFSFDGDNATATSEPVADTHGHVNNHTHRDDSDREARLTFRFVSSIEWMEIGSKVLVVPTVMAAGPVAGPPVVFNGLSGFVGRISNVYT